MVPSFPPETTLRKHAPPVVSRGRRLALFLILWGALALHLYRLDAQSLWYDEAVSAQVAALPVPDLVRWTADDIQPPLYYLLLHGWQFLAGRSEWALRFPSAWWGTLVVALGYLLGNRLFRSTWAGLLTASLLTFSPWLVYYSQEARMYTQLVALGMGLVYSVARGARHPEHSEPWLLGVAVLLILALLYTHYFGLFLVIALALWHLGTGWRRRQLRRVLRHWAATGGLTAIGYAPWVPFLWQRFRVDTSYWTGTLKLEEAFRHWVIHLTLGAPETTLERDAVRLIPLFAGVTAAAVLVLLWRAHTRPSLTLLLVWLLLPTLFILALAYRNPKFNPRYLIITYPAWTLTLAGALAFPSPLSHNRHLAEPRRFLLLAPFPLLLLLFLRADYRWFTDPAFTKPDFRGAITYVRQQRQPGEPVFLVSGHMSPVFDYYAPDLPRLRLPDIDVLDVEQVLGFDVASVLNQAIVGTPGAWLLLWQDDVVDPMGVVPYLLQRAGDEAPVPDAFWHVRLRHFLFPPHARVPVRPPVERPLNINLGNRITLLGISQDQPNAVSLFFRAQQPLREDYRVHLELWDAQGNFWGQADARPTGYNFPAFRWPPGRTVFGVHPLPATPGTPAGSYTLRVRIYSPADLSGLDVLDRNGVPQGKDIVISDILLSQTLPAPPPTAGVAQPPMPPIARPAEPYTRTFSFPARPYPFPRALQILPHPPLIPGQRLTVRLTWRSPRPPHPDDIAEIWLSNGGQLHALDRFSLADLPTPADTWPSTALTFTQRRWRLPHDLSPGSWQLHLTLHTVANEKESWPLATLTVLPGKRRFDIPPVTRPVDVIFGNAIRLVGLDLPPASAQLTTTLPVTVTWQALTEVDTSYTAFVHLLGPDERVLAQEDHIPGRGANPTDTWIAHEVIQDRFDLPLPDPLPAGSLTLEIGLYDALASGYPRLPITQGPGSPGNAVRVMLTLP